MKRADIVPRCRSCSLPPGTPRFFFDDDTDLEALARLLARDVGALCFYVQDDDEYVCAVNGVLIVLSRTVKRKEGEDPSELRLPDHPLYRVLHGSA